MVKDGVHYFRGGNTGDTESTGNMSGFDILLTLRVLAVLQGGSTADKHFAVVLVEGRAEKINRCIMSEQPSCCNTSYYK